MDLRPGGEARIETGRAEQVEADERLWEEAVPEMKGEVAVGRAEAGDEMVLEGADGPLGGVPTVKVGRGELEVDFRFRHKGLQCRGRFIVEPLESRFEATGSEKGVGAGVPYARSNSLCFIFIFPKLECK